MDSDLGPPRTCLAVEHWPEVDRRAFTAACSPRGPLDETPSRAADWRAPTRRRTRQGYGRWLSFLAWSGRLDGASTPSERITPEAVRAYVEALQSQIAPWTVWSYLVSLHQYARAIAPDSDWGWLYRLTAKLAVRRRPVRNKQKKLKPASEIATWALAELDRHDACAARDVTTALHYRDVMIIALLIHCPVRLRNVAMIRIGHHLKRAGAEFTLSYAADEWKTNRAIRFPLGERLSVNLQRWIDEWRPLLIRDPAIDALWLGIRGDAFGVRGIHKQVCALTERAFGAPINPHLFRDIAATSIAEEDPEHTGVASLILGHTHPKTTEDHYIHANQIRAGARHREVVEEMMARSRKLLRQDSQPRRRQRERSIP